jgi:formyltetrahydrofolate deformylase
MGMADQSLSLAARDTQKAPRIEEGERYILTLSCPDRMGIVAAMSGFLAEQGCDIVDSAQFGDRQNGTFFLRTSFISTRGVALAQLEAAFAPIAASFAMRAEFHDARAKTRTLVMVSRFGHCLNDLLYRCRIGALPIEIPLIVSNHTDFAKVAETESIRFEHLPVTPATKHQQEENLLRLIDDERIELIVLARYMQVLSSRICARLPGRVINIHHSFLPSFKGALPYQQAYARGVKLIGATAHYVTQDLDEGPIIEQAVERVNHGLSSEDYVAVGRDVESLVLARAVKWHAEHRIVINGNRTVVFA